MSEHFFSYIHKENKFSNSYVENIVGLNKGLKWLDIYVREDRSGNQEWTIQRNRQHCVH